MNVNEIEKIFSKISGGLLYVGFSGGADSTALLLLAKQFSEKIGFKLVAVHFEHGLRGDESKLEAEKAQKFAQQNQIEFLRFDLHIQAKENVEAEARQQRLEYWKSLAGNKSNVAVALGHHADDRTENLFIRLMRGSNVSGVAGLREEKIIDGVLFLRPLLSVTRQEIEDFLLQNNIETWNVDSSNSDDSFLRNFLRNEFLPKLYEKFPAGKIGLQKSAQNLELDADYLEQESCRLLQSGNPNDVAFWRQLHPALRPRVLRLWFQKSTGRDEIFSPRVLATFDIALENPEKQCVSINSLCCLCVNHERVELKEKQLIPKETIWDVEDLSTIQWGNWLLKCELKSNWNGKKLDLSTAAFSVEKFPPTLHLRSFRAGDKIIPFGQKNPSSLHKLRINTKASSHGILPIIDCDGQILWAPLVRHSALFIAQQGKPFWEFSIKKFDKF